MDNVLDPLDQAMFEFGRATGVTVAMQAVWVYNHPIDMDGLQKFHDHFQHGRLSRRIKRSPLPFGRHRWVAASDSPKIEVAASSRPREQFDTWLDEQATIRLDPERGPVWRLAVLHFTDGGAGVSLLVPHCVIDGLGLVQALADAALGIDDSIRWPAAASRRRWQALREDARQTARDTRVIGRAFRAAARTARQGSNVAAAAAPLPAVPLAADKPIQVPNATMFIDADEWEARANSLGGSSNALLAGLAAHLAARRGRLTTDGLVTLRLPVNERTVGDTRGNAVSNLDIVIDPGPATTDLSEIRATIKQALIRHRQVPDYERVMMSLVPLVPKRLIKRISGNATSVVATHLGNVDAAAVRPDGTDADYFAMRMHYPGVTEAMMHRFGGLEIIGCGRAHRQVFVTVLAYQPGCPNTNDALRHDLSSVLKDFSLTGTHL